MKRAFVHLELNVQNTQQAREFYSKLFDWEFSDIPMGDTVYTQIKPPSGPGGGIQKKPTPDAPPMWLPYVGVDSVKDTIARARDAGARIVADFMAVPGYGALAIIADPTGAWLGLWEAADASDADEWSPQPGTVDTPVEAPPKKGATKKKAAKKKAKKKAAKKKAAKKKSAKKKAAKKPAKKQAAKTKAAKKPAKKKAAKKPAKKKTAKKQAKKKTAKKRAAKKSGTKKKAAKKTGGKKKPAKRGTTKKRGRKRA